MKSGYIHRFMPTKCPTFVMVLGIASNEEHITLPHFFLQSVKVYFSASIDVLETVELYS